MKIKDLKKRIDETYKSMEKYSRLRKANGFIVNNQPFALIIRDALNEINKRTNK